MLNDGGVIDATEQLQILLARYMLHPKLGAANEIVLAQSYLSDESVLQKASCSKNSERFNAIWNGEVSDGKSPSEADMALATILAFWCGKDLEQMDRLFRRSKLMRDIWDRQQSGTTYGQLTLQKAAATVSNTYSPVSAISAVLNRNLRDSKKELEQAQARITKLDYIIQRLYEDNIEGKISNVRFAKMSDNYEEEQSTLTMRIAELKTLIANENENADNTDRFLAIVRKYTDITEFTAALIREFVEKIYVYKTERIDGKKVQRIKIIWNCIGEFNKPPNAENEKSA